MIKNKWVCFLVLFTLLVFTWSATNAQTEVSGDISGVWDTTGSPYIVTAEVHIPTGSMLAIMPGCSIIFQGHYKFCIDSNAVLRAIGSETDSIVFTAVDTNLTGSSGGHHGLRFFYSANSCTLSYLFNLSTFARVKI
ncbi:MAG: hypothetical protein JW737_08230 [Acidobacteria bacterium]|nr:hypothetical protein [Acidobacteriota bacterium]